MRLKYIHLYIDFHTYRVKQRINIKEIYTEFSSFELIYRK